MYHCQGFDRMWFVWGARIASVRFLGFWFQLQQQPQLQHCQSRQERVIPDCVYPQSSACLLRVLPALVLGRLGPRGSQHQRGGTCRTFTFSKVSAWQWGSASSPQSVVSVTLPRDSRVFRSGIFQNVRNIPNEPGIRGSISPATPSHLFPKGPLDSPWI